jgi:short-subunit dehydrogenase
LLAQFETNVFGVVKITRAMLPHMRERRSGTLVFMGSRSGWYGDPFCGAYAGSKFALEGLVESLRWETELFGIKTLLVDPGRFRTAFLSSGRNLVMSEARISDYQEAYQSFLDQIAGEDGKQPGDVSKAVSTILDLVRREGVAGGREVPFRLPLGTDCYQTIKEECEETLKELQQWSR